MTFRKELTIWFIFCAIITFIGILLSGFGVGLFTGLVILVVGIILIRLGRLLHDESLDLNER